MRLALALMLALLPTGAFACGPDTDCQVGDRTYRIATPDGVQNPGALVFSHGFRGSAAGAMRNGGLRRLANERGMALIAMQGINGTWDLPGTPGNPRTNGKAELAYFEAVFEDAEQRFGIDADNIVATGFSAGGMMTWNLACHRSDLIRGAVPMSGTFWEPVPTTCDSPPMSVVHIHGDADRTVPLSGRAIGSSHQGDVPTALGMYARYGGFGNEVNVRPGALNCAKRTNAAADILAFCIFSGGHSFRLENLRAGLDMLN